jgi:hypothetical protein
MRMRSWSSSVSIVSDYRLDDRATGIRLPAEAKDFSSSLCVQTTFEAHLTSYPVVTGGLFLGLKRGRYVTLTTYPRLVPRTGMRRSYTSAPFILHSSRTAFRLTLPLKSRVYVCISNQGDGDGGSTHLWNVGRHRIENTAVHSRRLWTKSNVSIVENI